MQIEAHFGSSEDVISCDDEDVVFGFLQVVDVFGCVFFEGGAADEKSTKL